VSLSRSPPEITRLAALLGTLESAAAAEDTFKATTTAREVFDAADSAYAIAAALPADACAPLVSARQTPGLILQYALCVNDSLRLRRAAKLLGLVLTALGERARSVTAPRGSPGEDYRGENYDSDILLVKQALDAVVAVSAATQRLPPPPLPSAAFLASFMQLGRCAALARLGRLRDGDVDLALSKMTALPPTTIARGLLFHAVSVTIGALVPYPGCARAVRALAVCLRDACVNVVVGHGGGGDRATEEDVRRKELAEQIVEAATAEGGE
jgi:hypothetical protein